MNSQTLNHVRRRCSSRVQRLLCITIAVLTLLLLRAPPAAVGTSQGGLDPSFNRTGKLIIDFGAGNNRATTLAIQADGKIVVAGFTSTASGGIDFTLVRLTTYGSLDPSFGNQGKVTTDFGHSIDYLSTMAIQSDGKIIVAGNTSKTNLFFDFALARYEVNGSLDTSFGTGGKVITDFNNSDDTIYSMAVQPDGKIVVAGDMFTFDRTADFALARYDANGNLDPSFGNEGKVITDLESRSDVIRSMAIQPDGKIVVGGSTITNGPSPIIHFGLARYDTNGSLDSTFGSGGEVITAFGGYYDFIGTLVLQVDGKIVVGGTIEASQSNGAFGLARYEPNGDPDLSFGSAGKVTTDFSPNSDRITDLTIQPDGKIVTVGSVSYPTTNDTAFALARYDVNGSLDASFGRAGTVIIDIQNSYDEATGLALQTDGKIVVAGSTAQANETWAFAVVRYGDNISTIYLPIALRNARLAMDTR